MADRRGILVTRPVLDARTAALIRARGYEPVAAPLLCVTHRSVAVPPGIQAILITSGNALPGLRPATVPLFAVGDGTAARARAAGFADVRSASGDASALARLVGGAADPRGGALLLASGAGQGEALARSLRTQGFRVVRRVAYAARPVTTLPDAAVKTLHAGTLHAALFLSAETAAAFVRLLPTDAHVLLAGVRALAIGQPAARALEALPWLAVCRARTPTLDDVLALI